MKTYKIAFQLSKHKVFVFSSHDFSDGKMSVSLHAEEPKNDDCFYFTEQILKPYSDCNYFYEKWKDLTSEFVGSRVYDAMRFDLNFLKREYNFIEEESEEVLHPFSTFTLPVKFEAEELIEFSCQTPKKQESIFERIINSIKLWFYKRSLRNYVPPCWKYYI